MQKKPHEALDWRQLGAKVNGKTRDVCDARALLNEKTRHSHGRDSANPVKMHAKITSYSENPVKMHTKNPTRAQIQGAVKAEGLPDKENPGPQPLPGKKHTKHEIDDRWEQK